jgi:hypothetical protein
MYWATFWAIFPQNSSGHPGSEAIVLTSVTVFATQVEAESHFDTHGVGRALINDQRL